MPGRMQDVHLVEDDPLDPAPTGDLPRPPRPRWQPALRPALAGVLAVALALTGTQLVLDARERARVAELADVRGVLRPLDPGVGVRWEAAAADAAVVESGTAVGDVVVGVAPLPGPRVEVRALDDRTGVLRWSRELDLPTPAMSPSAAEPATWTACTPLVADDGSSSHPAVGCLAQQPGGDTGPAPQVAVWFLDAADGTLLSSRRLPGSAAFSVLGGLFLAAERVDERAGSARWRLTAQDPSGRTAWTFTTPRVPATRDSDVPADLWSTSYASLDARGERVLLSVGTSSWLLDAGGALQRRDPVEVAWWPELARGGVVVHSTWSQDGEPRARVLLPDGRPVDVRSAPLWLSVDDGSAPGAVLFSTRAGRRDGTAATVSALDASSGAVRWRVTGLEASAAVLLRGRLYLTGPDGLAAVDASTGRVLWTTPLERPADELATDGRWLLLRGPGPVVEAYATADGQRAWRADLSGAVDAGTDLRVGWQVPHLYAVRPDGTVAVLG
ncbi:PQQ-binding-like beta-propeller repeat protein [Cellulomonas fimi]|uniref:Pyrrolo-quinoline quinone repeat domain-containing protein n=1 Tax=Cellulomonas fimi (strain ATCC 484 / DSM 20113 / JCM 1341 / CCUG 24087 / LMG 16345 / NBRC 15513 / NCIMB 8980 / NCTC 7547 / NRS-133) TaxID=590998 RepID=F4GY83_CELFA|nr:PQQ-binding-like beta-propeller repeat protein [Cellulomonas fimi]AEE44751.1 hypothetical protein Celf_0611 [Cellulomonas fimi ATCC 484]NNH06108.1 PQQ-binding-like beta-propeller repeat protein [Cellulomonas fimi]VEH27192.1 outer membrane assembly lipoprotein YfgL [Cellulomonas fimi]